MPKFSKKHYEAIAELISKLSRETVNDYEIDDGTNHQAIEENAIIAAFIHLFTPDNPNFNSVKFIKACEQK